MTRLATTDRSVLAAVADDVLHLIDLAIAEDQGPGDWTSRWTIPARTRARARIIAKAEGTVAGLTPALAVFMRLDGRIESNRLVDEGSRVRPGDVLLELHGPARSILTGERVALNFMQRLSGIATLTRRYVDAVAGTHTRILDTRKTTPGWRTLEKDAVRAGGGTNHRRGLFDAVLIKDNHIAIAGTVAEAVRRVRDHNTRDLHVTIEVATLDDLDAVLGLGIDRVLCDNMDLEMLHEAVRRVRRHEPAPEVEASGNMTLERVRAVAETGVDFISAGALTHSSTALDVSLQIMRS